MAVYSIDNMPSKLSVGDVINCDYSGSMKSCTLPKGTYKLECWGAQGGNGSGTNSSHTNGAGGNGGYSVGTIQIYQPISMYAYVGGQGKTGSSYQLYAGGFNGGGSNYTYGSGGSGGGASDIRIGQDSLYARVIVAGGGGGTGWTYYGGVGGGISGISKYSASYNSSQTSGASAYSSGGSYQSVTGGSFGQGGNGTGSSEGGSGGGGGWYGGGGAGYTGGSAGGSGYVYTIDTASNYPSGCLLNSTYYLTDAQTISGDTSFLSPSGTSETGHTGNGYVRITAVKSSSSGPFRAKVSNEWKETEKAYIKIGSDWWLVNSAYEKNPQTQKWRSII